MWACKERVSEAQCDALVTHYATLVVREHNPDASAAVVAEEQAREREASHLDEGFRNCTRDVQPAAMRCALASTTSDGVLKCLE
jgi:hypothetical protein